MGVFQMETGHWRNEMGLLELLSPVCCWFGEVPSRLVPVEKSIGPGLDQKRESCF